MINSFSENTALRFFSSTSNWGILTMYSCYLSYKKTSPFLLHEITDFSATDENYAYGFMVACYSTGCFKYSNKKTNEGKRNIYVSDFDEELSINIEQEITKRCKINPTFNTSVEKIEKYFAYQRST